MDGARLANAAVALDLPLRALTVEAGVDLLSLGGTKNGMMYGEAICLFTNGAHERAAAFTQKQSMQLASKMRYIAAQFEALLRDRLWSRYASHANAMAAGLHERLRQISGVRITRPVRCNAIFATLSPAAVERIREQFFFYVFDETLPEVRWMTHWATTPQDVDDFAKCIAAAVTAAP